MRMDPRRGLLFLSSGLAAGLLVFCTGDDPQLRGTVVGSDGAPSTKPPGPSTTDDAGTVSGPLLETAVAITTGAGHTCAVTSEGAVLCWGDNTKGQLGVPSAGLPSSSVPVRVPLPEKTLAVSAGARHTCAVTEARRVVCWGDGAAGQIGNGPADAGFTLVMNGDGGPLERIAEVSAGSNHTCARESPPAVPIGSAFVTFGPGHCWGSNVSYALGQLAPYGPTPTRATALPPLAPGAGDLALAPYFFASALAVGTDFACARGGYALPGSGTPAAGPVCWGANDKQQLGRDGGASARPQIVVTARDGALVSTDRIAVGQSHVCVVSATGATPALYCWGDNGKGQLGDAGTPNGAVPVSGIDASKIKALAAGGSVTCVIEQPAVRCVGANDQGQRGDDTINTTANTAWSTVDVQRPSAIAVSGTHACAVLGGAPGAPGPVACWGSNTSGQLGDGLDLTKGYPEAGRAYLRAKPVRVQAPR